MAAHTAHKRIFITGGAMGLGRALAQRYARAGYRVCIGDVNDARGAETAEELVHGGADAFYLHCDVTQEAELSAVARQLEERWGGVDIVVNNAGVATAGKIEDASLADWQWVLDINLLGVVRGCRVFTPLFKKQGSGYFVNIASAAGLLNVPFMSSYNVSKAGVVALSETIETELADDNIGVSVVCPSFFKTNLADRMRTTDAKLRTVTGKLLERGKLSADDVADYIFRAVASRSFYVLPHKPDERIWLAKRALPRRLFAAAVVKRARKFR
jgi:NAD(P)-dependent dehydrogenase (short-subunit alcohol dehydrogenase family)